jgi:hypothetical protein
MYTIAITRTKSHTYTDEKNRQEAHSSSSSGFCHINYLQLALTDGEALFGFPANETLPTVVGCSTRRIGVRNSGDRSSAAINSHASFLSPSFCTIPQVIAIISAALSAFHRRYGRAKFGLNAKTECYDQ